MSRFAIVAFLLSCCSILVAQTEAELPLVEYGGFIDYSANHHTADFQQLPGVANCCPQFTAGSGSGVAFGGLFDYRIARTVSIGTRIAYASLSGTLSHEEPTTVIIGGVSQDGAFLHELNASLGELALQPSINYSPVPHLLLSGGVSIGAVIHATYSQQESISKPSASATFVDENGNDTHTRIRNQSQGALPDASSIRIAPFVSAGYRFPLNTLHTLMLSPEVSYGIGVTPVISNLRWHVNTLRFGLSVMYAPLELRKEYRKQEIIDTVRRSTPEIAETQVRRGVAVVSIEESTVEGTAITTELSRRTDTLFIAQPRPMRTVADLQATVDLVALNVAGEEAPFHTMVVEELAARVLTPLLNYIFFDENSAAIPARYIRLTSGATNAFDVDKTNSSAKLPTYHQLLNIVGKRMREHPTAKITLTGCNQDLRDEKGNTELSRSRADAVKSYLQTVWGIVGTRMVIVARNLPEKAANTATQDGAEENRRVEITADDQSLLAPIFSTDTVLNVAPGIVGVRTVVVAEHGVAGYRLTMSQHGHVLKVFEGNGAAPDMVDWRVQQEHETTPRGDDTLDVAFTVRDGTGDSVTAHAAMPLEQLTFEKKRSGRVVDKEVDRFSLILFDVRSAEIAGANLKTIDIIRSALRPNSTVAIRGYTDRLGDARFNQQLAEQRARATASAINEKKIASVEGIGQATLYDSALPEGRLYTRTVDVTVETAK